MQPRNYLLFACHATNATAQSLQDYRFVNYWYLGGREKKLAEQASSEEKGPVTQAVEAAQDVKKSVPS